MIDWVRSFFRWFTTRSGYLMLVANDARISERSAASFAGAWWQVLVLSVLWGIGQVYLWAVAWRTFNDFSGLPLMPVAVVVGVMFLWVYRGASSSLAERLVGRRDRALAQTVLVVIWALVLLGLAGWNRDWPINYPVWIRWARPIAVFRPLILAPVWGAWGMMVTCLFARQSFTMRPPVAAYAAKCGPLTTAAVMGAALAMSLWYFDYLSWLQVAIPASAAVAAVVGGLILSGGGRRLTRGALLATNLITQLAFLAAYVAIRK